MKAHPSVPGDKYHEWEILREVQSDKAHRKAEAKCSCGRIQVVNLASVRCGQSRSCKSCSSAMATRKHGKWKSTEYTIWSGIKQRCHNPKSPSYFKYGARGIQVCEKWRASFETFFGDVGPRPSLDHSLDRFPDNDGNYEPGNVRWATRAQQARNQRYDIWKRVVLILAADHADEIVQMMERQVPDHELARHIAAVYRPSSAWKG